MMMSRRALLAGLGLACLPGRVLAEDALFDTQIAAANLGGTVSFAAIDSATGQVIAARQPDLQMAPASTLKTVTALFALDRLGPDHRFSTRVLRMGDTLILAGGGDPVLDTDALAVLAAQTAKAWTGAAPTAFQVWGGALPQIARLSRAQDDYLPYNPTISGMILNFNRVHLDWAAGKLALEARGARQTARSYTVTVAAADRSQPLFTYDDSGKLESWTIARGSMGKSGARWLPVRRPELYAGDVFQTLCRAKGLVLPAPTVIADLPDAASVAQHDSPPLDQILRGMLEYSTNLTAEVVGMTASGAPDLAASTAAMSDWLTARDPSARFAFYDHSGLSPDNRITAMTLARLMADQGPDGVLASLLKHIPLSEKQGANLPVRTQVLAKTGTLNFVSNLTGYAGAPTGRQIAFAILTGDESRRAASEGQELPAGVLGWTKRSKSLQMQLINDWIS